MITKPNLFSVSKNIDNTIYLDRNFTDTIKFLSCLMIAVHHYSQYILYNEYSDSYVFKIFSAQGGFLGVAIFFFLSGYGLMISEKKNHLSFFTFIKRRLSKVYLPVILITCLWLPVYHSFIIKDCNIIDILINVFWGWGDSVLWFVKSLLYLYVLFYIYSFIRLKINNDFIKIISLGILAFLSFIFQYYSLTPWSAISIPCFYIGIFIAEYNRIKSFFSILIFINLSILIYIYFFCNKSLLISASINYIVLFIWNTLSIKYIIQISILPKWVGKLSFDIYLTHMKCLKVLLLFYPYVHFGVFMSCSIISAYLFYRLRSTFNI